MQMKKYGLCLLAALMAVMATFAVLFLCTHSSMLPEKRTEYYEQKAKAEADSATGAEAELMALLLGAAPAAPAEEEKNVASFSFQTSDFSRVLAVFTLVFSLIYVFFYGRKPEENKGALWAYILAVPLGLIGARLLYCLTDVVFYLKDIEAPAAMLKMWEGGLSLTGALSCIALAGVMGAKIANEKPLHVLNQMAPFLLLFAISVPAANTYIGAGWGPEVSLPLFFVNVNHQKRLDTAGLTVLILIALWFVLEYLFRKKKLPQNRRFFYTALLFGCVMVPLESLRRDGHMVWGFVHAEMLYAMMIALPAGLVLAKKNRRIPLLIATALLAGAVIGLEFMLDRSAINDWLLYGVYLLCMAGYIFVGLKWANTSCEQAKNNV